MYVPLPGPAPGGAVLLVVGVEDVVLLEETVVVTLPVDVAVEPDVEVEVIVDEPEVVLPVDEVLVPLLVDVVIVVVLDGSPVSDPGTSIVLFPVPIPSYPGIGGTVFVI